MISACARSYACLNSLTSPSNRAINITAIPRLLSLHDGPRGLGSRLAPAWSVGSTHDLAVPLASPIVPPRVPVTGAARGAGRAASGNGMRLVLPAFLQV